MIRNVAFLSILALGLLPQAAHAELKYDYKGQGYELELREEANDQIVIISGEIMPLDGTKPLKTLVSMLTPGKDIVVAINRSMGGETGAFRY
ncbi:MAG: hypothetical protein AAB250_11975, partial [Bdellovibrionota bacterium]